MSKTGMAGGLSTRDFRQQLRYLPTPNTLYTIDFPRLDGGLNMYELDYRLKANESPDMRNLRWRDGALGCRFGQEYIVAPGEGEAGYAAHSELFWGYAFVHVDDELRCFNPLSASATVTVLQTGVPTNRGTFFRFGDYLMYKNKGGYYRIGYDPLGATTAAKFPITTAAQNEFVPVTYINCAPTTHAGSAYQPENRLSRKRTMWYSAVAGVQDYTLPYGTAGNHIDDVTAVTVDGLAQTEGSDYSVVINHGTQTAYVHFTTAPPVSNPFVANTVHITYSITGDDADAAEASVMDCPYAIVYGGDQNLCVVLGGCPAQPNAYFWSDNDQYAMNPFYFPMEHYNLAGDTESAIMGFGKQQGFLVILAKKGVGKAKFGTTTTSSDRLQIEMPYTAINSRFGCDFPWSIQLVDNNIVFANQEHGVCFLADSSAAYENNIIEMGKKINGNEARHGMLYDTFVAQEGGVYSTVFEDKYWLVANGNAYIWDFRLSGVSDPVWFFYTNIRGISFIQNADTLYHLSADGGASEFRRDHFSDYGNAIEKVYQFATQMMGTYDRLKDVRSVLLSIRSDTGGGAQILYITDYENRYDLTPIPIWEWSLVPWDLANWDITAVRFAMVVRRAPMCRHIRHFGMRLENNVNNQDLSVISAQVQYTFSGRQR